MQHYLMTGVCAVVCLAMTGMAHTQEAQSNNRTLFVVDTLQAAQNSVLDNLRGGFDMGATGQNLVVSFGFLRSVTINGALVSRIQFSLPNLANITADQARQVGDALAQAKVVQNGQGNSVPGNMGAAGLAAATVVQNSLNNQNIQTLTQIDAGANTLQSMRSIFLQGTLTDALLRPLGVH